MLTAALVIAALVAGVLLGAVWQRRRAPRHQAVEPVPPLLEEQTAGEEAAPVPRLPQGLGRPGLAESFYEQAVAVVERAGSSPDDAAVAVTLIASDAWALGVSELRDAMVRTSGLPVEIVDDVASAAILSLVSPVSRRA